MTSPKNYIILPKLLPNKDYSHKLRSREIYKFALRGCEACSIEKNKSEEGEKEKEWKVKRSPMRAENHKKQPLRKVEIVYGVGSFRQRQKDMESERKKSGRINMMGKSCEGSRGKTLPALLRNTNKDFLEEAFSKEYHIRANKVNHHLTPLIQQADEERSLASQNNSFYKPKNLSKIAPCLQSISKTQRFHHGSLNKPFMTPSAKSTCFQTLLQDHLSTLLPSSDNPSPRTRTSSNCSVDILNKQDLQNFISNYQPLNKDFDIRKLSQSELFTTVTYKTGVYFGEVVGKKRHGEGVFITDKYVFEGKFSNGIKEFGYEKNKQGMYYGRMKDGLRDGEGEFEWNSGEKYKGMWEKGMKHGKGVWTGLNGDSYEGDWKENKQEGTGVHKHPKSVYEGEFLNFLKHGEGKEVFENGDIYVGSYQSGKPHGLGIYTWKNGERYEGEFVNGSRSEETSVVSNISLAKEKDPVCMKPSRRYSHSKRN